MQKNIAPIRVHKRRPICSILDVGLTPVTALTQPRLWSIPTSFIAEGNLTLCLDFLDFGRGWLKEGTFFDSFSIT